MTKDRRGGLTSDDVWLLNEGRHFRLSEKLGSHPDPESGTTRFAVLAPDAGEVSVVGDFNEWDPAACPLQPVGQSGVWEGSAAAPRGSRYKYRIASRGTGYRVQKADPFAWMHETPPNTASIVWDLDYAWQDEEWMATRGRRNALDAPISIYEVHLGSWRRGADGVTYRGIAAPLAEYAAESGFTHVEFLPLMEHPFTGSWGYQTTGYFAPTSRFGPPQDLMYLIDTLHRAGIGVILDWVPSHFPTDEHGLAFFDGTHLYEHADPRQGFHPDWKSAIFNYARKEVRSFLGSSALFWLERYHADGLRVDAVASMLYLDYSRQEGEWIPNAHGGRENLDAISLLREINTEAYRRFPDVQMIAEESTAWPGVARPVDAGGLGFGLKWDMGWMNDTLSYFGRDPIHRRYHHDELTFRLLYAFSENFLLPLSHDEVVHGKRSLLEKMPGDDWQKFANLRLLFSYLFVSAGKKLLFMGGELGERREWSHDGEIDWGLRAAPWHEGVRRLVADLNRLYREFPALHRLDTSPEGFEWIDCRDASRSILAILRRGGVGPEVVAVLNFTPLPREDYAVGFPSPGAWREIFNSDSGHYAGSGIGNLGRIAAVAEPLHGRPASASITIPPLGAVFFAPEESPSR
ncbi:MAG TPA: 1,4-alpha-glucan branching protein GlgB [Thermoanaerobaculia bacterium]|nr:1,4-alpha-glucan branching protein GlgB [Thermoanaerobaculia bacterium]